MTDRITGYKLLHTGSLVNFDVLDTRVDLSAVGDEALVTIELRLGEVEEDQELEPGEEPERTRDQEWGAFGFIFCLAVLSFADARPRGNSGIEFVEDDEFTVGDLFECLRFESGDLRFDADYLRGRCMKTDVTVRKDSTATLATRCRGEAAIRWIRTLKGKKTLEAVN